MYLSELVQLCGVLPLAVPPPEVGFAVSPWGESEVMATDLLLLDSQVQQVPPILFTLPRVTVGIGATTSRTQPCDVGLPEEEEALLRLLSDMELGESGVPPDPTRIVLVGAWQGGVGVTKTAVNLAAVSSSMLVDAAGKYGPEFPEDDGLGWSDLDPTDLPPPTGLVAALPRKHGVPMLGPRAGLPVRADSKVVSEVLRATTRDSVVDCGSDLVALNALAKRLAATGKGVRTILVGRATYGDVRALAQACGSGLVGEGTVCLLRGGIDRLFPAVESRCGLTVRGLPRTNSRHWQLIWAQLWEQ